MSEVVGRPEICKKIGTLLTDSVFRRAGVNRCGRQPVTQLVVTVPSALRDDCTTDPGTLWPGPLRERHGPQ